MSINISRYYKWARKLGQQHVQVCGELSCIITGGNVKGADSYFTRLEVHLDCGGLQFSNKGNREARNTTTGKYANSSTASLRSILARWRRLVIRQLDGFILREPSFLQAYYIRLDAVNGYMKIC